MRVLLDTNIIYDILCKRPYDADGLLQLKVMETFGDVDLWISAKSYTDLFYLIAKELGSEQAQALLESTLEWLSVCSVEEDDIKSGLQARWSDFEDCLVNICAEKVKADYLITRDAHGFDDARIPHGSASSFMGFVFEKTNVRYALEGAADG